MRVVQVTVTLEISDDLVDEETWYIGRLVEKMIENNGGDGMYVRDYEATEVDDGEEADTGDAGE